MNADRDGSTSKLRIVLIFIAVFLIVVLLLWVVATKIATPWLRNTLGFVISSVGLAVFWVLRDRNQRG